VFDFDGVMTDNSVWVSETGQESVRCSRAEGYGLQLLRELGIAHCVLSSEVNPVVSRRCEKLKIPCYQGFEDKTDFLEKLVSDHGLDWAQVAYVGNDVNDVPCLERVGVPIVVQDAYPVAVAVARFQTRRPGGHGAVREVCEWLAACHLQAAPLPEKSVAESS
jgi:YrbI family 3-deoxy-D-manno-octulosonate 8-phosphate phosphatase